MTRTFDPTTLTQPERHGYLLAAIAPRPIAFASTVDAEGNVNLSPYSFFNVFSSNPPVVIFSPSRSGRDNTTKDTYENVLQVPEVVINIVNHPMVEQMSLSSAPYASDVNEFAKAGFTEVPSERVRPPRVGEAPVAFECTVQQVMPLGDQGGAGNLVIARVELMHIQEQYLDANEKLDTTKLDLVARMGGSWYCRATGEALFEIARPLRAPLGVDALPERVRFSSVLTGNDLGQLGNLASPTPKALAAAAEDAAAQAAHAEGEAALHQHARTLLQAGDADQALATLLAFS